VEQEPASPPQQQLGEGSAGGTPLAYPVPPAQLSRQPPLQRPGRDVATRRKLCWNPCSCPGVTQRARGIAAPSVPRSRPCATVHVLFVTAKPRCNPSNPTTAQDPSPQTHLCSQAAGIAVKMLTGARSPRQPPRYWQRKSARLTPVPEPARLWRNPPALTLKTACFSCCGI